MPQVNRGEGLLTSSMFAVIGVLLMHFSGFFQPDQASQDSGGILLGMVLFIGACFFLFTALIVFFAFVLRLKGPIYFIGILTGAMEFEQPENLWRTSFQGETLEEAFGFYNHWLYQELPSDVDRNSVHLTRGYQDMGSSVWILEVQYRTI